VSVPVGSRSSGCCRERARAWFTNRRVPRPPTPEHVVERILTLQRGLGLDPAATLPAFLIAADPATERRMETLLGGNRSTPLGSLVGVNSGSSDAGQRWPTEAFRRLGDELAVRLDAGTP